MFPVDDKCFLEQEALKYPLTPQIQGGEHHVHLFLLERSK